MKPCPPQASKRTGATNGEEGEEAEGDEAGARAIQNKSNKEDVKMAPVAAPKIENASDVRRPAPHAARI